MMRLIIVVIAMIVPVRRREAHGRLRVFDGVLAIMQKSQQPAPQRGDRNQQENGRQPSQRSRILVCVNPDVNF